MTHPTFDDRDALILQKRVTKRDTYDGPRVGDWVIMPDGGWRRFTYRWPDALQTTRRESNDTSFYFGEGFVSFSGSLDHSIPVERIAPVPELEQEPAPYWFFHHDEQRAHNGVHCTVPSRIFIVTPEGV